MKTGIDTLEKRIEKYVKEEGEELPPDQTNAFQSIIDDDESVKFFNLLPDKISTKKYYGNSKWSSRITTKTNAVAPYPSEGGGDWSNQIICHWAN